MKFVKGMLIGGIVTAGVAMMYSEEMGDNKRKMMKRLNMSVSLLVLKRKYIMN